MRIKLTFLLLFSIFFVSTSYVFAFQYPATGATSEAALQYPVPATGTTTAAEAQTQAPQYPVSTTEATQYPAATIGGVSAPVDQAQVPQYPDPVATTEATQYPVPATGITPAAEAQTQAPQYPVATTEATQYPVPATGITPAVEAQTQVPQYPVATTGGVPAPDTQTQVPQSQSVNEAMKDTADTSEEAEEMAIKGLDTVSVREPEGNWLLKRVWWEKAQRKYEKIKEVVTKILESRMVFFDKRNELEKNVLNPFYSTVGLEDGQLSQIVSTFMEMINKAKEEGETLGDAKNEFLEKLKLEEINLKQLKADIKGIKNLDDFIDQDINKLIQQINRSRRYEDNAWQLFKGIAKELSHKKARELYYKMDALWKNVKSIHSYIKGPFLNHFDSIIEDAKTNVASITEITQGFKNKGIDLKKKHKELIEKETSRDSESSLISQDTQNEDAKSDQDQDQDNDEDDNDDDDDNQMGFLSWIWSKIIWPFRAVWGLISKIWS